MSELRPCPLCSEHLWPCNEGFEHPASDTCPLDNMWFPERLVAAWNTRDTPTLSAAMGLPEAKALKDERDAATAAYWRVRSYAVHDDDCTINRYPNRNACSCGLRNALAAIKEPKT